MGVVGPARDEINVLEADPDLMSELDPGTVEAARRFAVAPVTTLDAGQWDPVTTFRANRGLLGLLVLEGLLLQEAAIEGMSCGELLGAGDVLRPWEHAGLSMPVPYRARFTVLEPTPVAVLDRRFTWVISRWPEVGSAILGRALGRADLLQFHYTLTSVASLDERLHVLLWQLADRWGKRVAEGVALRLPLSHDVLGRIACAQRPSVTRSLKRLQERQALVRLSDRTWILTGPPPTSSPWRTRCATAASVTTVPAVSLGLRLETGLRAQAGPVR